MPTPRASSTDERLAADITSETSNSTPRGSPIGSPVVAGAVAPAAKVENPLDANAKDTAEENGAREKKSASSGSDQEGGGSAQSSTTSVTGPSLLKSSSPATGAGIKKDASKDVPAVAEKNANNAAPPAPDLHLKPPVDASIAGGKRPSPRTSFGPPLIGALRRSPCGKVCPPRFADTDCEVQGNIFVHKAIQIRVINWYQVFEVYYLKHLYVLGAALLLYSLPSDLLVLSEYGYETLRQFGYTRLFAGAALLLFFHRFSPHWRSNVYCVDFECAAPPEEWSMSKEETKKILQKQPTINEKSQEFLDRILNTSGIGDGTAWPPCILHGLDAKGGKPWAPTLSAARGEAEVIVFPTVERLLKRTGVKPKEIDYLIVNCSLFCPTPSICAMIANHFEMRADICSYNLGGMGCSANVISVDLAKQLLQHKPNALALVVSTENLSQNLYCGNDRSMMLQNTLFRCGGVASLLSSRSQVKGKYAKYKLLHSGRTFMTDNESYQCVFQDEEAENGMRGVRLDRNIVTVAGRAMTKQFTQLAPHVLPISEQVKTVLSMAYDYACKNFLHDLAPKMFPPKYKVYTPNFKKCIDHFCIHAGGRAVIEGVKKNLRLTDRDVEPSFETLRQWGNTSSSSIWYELQYIENQKGRLKPGHQVLQIAFGSGFKCNSAVWLRL
ncbi:unnamed protein product [Amoebophrya sp. A25]|nr:unnamed protein product [Amoebophrya sp. A25]|eukprot:GSA25T00019094001.1